MGLFLSVKKKGGGQQSKMIAPTIAIYGPEGAGKSTTVAALQQYLQSHNRKAKAVFLGRGKNNIIPINKLGKRYKEREIQQQPIGKSTISISQNILYTSVSFLFALDLLLRYGWHVLPARLNGTIVICDRYSSDLYLMDKVAPVVRKFLLCLFPKPARTFYLHNTVEVLHKRKGRSVENLQWQMKQFAILNKRYAAIAINTDSEEKTLQQIIENIKPVIS